MTKTLKITDENISGIVSNEITLIFDKERITLADIIKQRVEHEIKLINDKFFDSDKNLVMPSYDKLALSKPSIRDKTPQIDIEKQTYVALDGFQKNMFFVLINDTQIENLEEEFLIDSINTVNFIKLNQLVGG